MKTFWLNRGNWPSDTSEYVFLANAILRVGKALYPNSWNDFDPAVELPRDPATVKQRSYVRLKGWKPPVISPEQAEAQAKKEQKEQETRRVFLNRLRRFQGTKARIVSEAEREEGLRTACRLKSGFGFRPIPREWWQVNNTSPRFEICQINTAFPADRAFGGTGSGWAHIFVYRADLEKLLSEITGITVSDGPTFADQKATTKIEALPRASKDALKAFASELDNAGISVRDLRMEMVEERWDKNNGAVPRKKEIVGEMKGQPKGRQKGS